MIPIDTLRYLSVQKMKDADILFRHSRNSGAIYLMGYALELSLKRTISLTLGFARGFPETKSEFYTYTDQIDFFHSLGTGMRITSIRQLRIHDLDVLLDYSGQHLRVSTLLPSEWLIVHNWSPEGRYVRSRVTAQRAQDFLQTAKIIIREIS